MECIFCKIVKGDIPANVIYRDAFTLAFHDINPQAPHHIVIIPHQHIETLNDINESNSALTGHMLQAATNIAKQLAIDNDGYRFIINCNANGGQSVFHIHAHLLGGRRLAWPPG